MWDGGSHGPTRRPRFWESRDGSQRRGTNVEDRPATNFYVLTFLHGLPRAHSGRAAMGLKNRYPPFALWRRF